jgi:hypothetical protein
MEIINFAGVHTLAEPTYSGISENYHGESMRTSDVTSQVMQIYPFEI